MILPLKNNYQHSIEEGIKTVYDKDFFGLELVATHSKHREEVEVESALIRLSNNQRVKTFPKVIYTKDGEPGEVKNQGKVDAYQASVNTLLEEIKTLRADKEAKKTDRDELPQIKDGKKNEAWAAADEAYNEALKAEQEKERDYQELASKPVQPKRDTVNQYTDAVGYFDFNNDSLSANGKNWIKKFKPGGVKIADDIEVEEAPVVAKKAKSKK